MKQRALLLILFSCLHYLVIAQPVNTLVQDVVLSPPNAAALGKYGDIPVSYATGIPSINVPICNVMDGKLNLPVSINFHAGGLKVGETASWVGQGWSLDAGGMISRTILGLADESAQGYRFTGDQIDPNDRNDICEINNGGRDGEADLFAFNLPGFSGKFFFDAMDSIFIMPQHLDLKIEYEFNGGAGGFQRFDIITNNGTKYIFGKNDAGVTAYEGMRTGSTSTWRTSWMLLRIESHDGVDAIDFSYELERYSYKNLASCNYKEGSYPGASFVENCPGSNGVDIANHDYILQYVDGQRLTGINSSTEMVTFIADTVRADLVANGTQDAKRLDAIEIATGTSTTFCRRFNFAYDYFEDMDYNATTSPYNLPYFRRLQLNKIQEIACNGSASKNPYEFFYAGPTTQAGKNILPNRLSKAIDHWGYYNGESDNENISANIPPTTLKNPETGVTYTYGSAKRDSEEYFMQHGVLNKIIYPTGGHTEFIFEGNRANLPVSTTPIILIQNLSTCGTPGTACCGTLNASMDTSFLDVAQIENAYFDLEIAGFSPVPNSCQSPIGVDVQVWQGNTYLGMYGFNASGVSGSVSGKPLSEFPVTFSPNITYTFKVISQNGRGLFNLYSQSDVLDEVVVGGLRVKEIRNHDGLNANRDIIKTYDYPDIANGNLSSGKLANFPSYGYAGSFTPLSQPTYYYAHFFANSQVPLGEHDGRHLIYQQVVENHNGNGKVVYKFRIDTDNSPTSIYGPGAGTNGSVLSPPRPQLFKVNHGQQETQITYNEAGEVIAKDSIIIPTTSYSYATGTFLKVAAILCSGNFSTNYYGALLYSPRTDGFVMSGKRTTIDGVTTTTDFSYDSNFRHHAPTAIEMTNSDGEVYTTYNEYVFDHASEAVYDSMVSRNMIAMPVKTKTVVDGDTISGTYTISNFFTSGGQPNGSANDPIYPHEFYNYEMTWDATGNPVTTGWDLQGTILAYDDMVGKPKTVQQNGWLPETYIWDAVNKQIKTRKYKDFTWTYNYFPNTRLVAEIIDIDGQDTDFTYDQLMRLQTTNARDGHVITNYTYYYTSGVVGDYNYVKTRTDLTPVTGSDLDWTESWQYIDGLGRPLQTVQRRHATDLKDVVFGAVRYDNQGRPVSQFEPFVGSVNSGAFTAIPSGQDSTFTTYYASPLNRIYQVTPPAWYPTTNEYANNGSSISIGGVTYPAGSLNKVTTTDPENLTSITYTDKRGRPVLSQQEKGNDQTNTYTIYDVKDRVKTILPPDIINATSALAYQYQYDGANNVLKKYIPDMGWINYLYDTRNLLTANQDPNLLLDNKWLSTIYDDYGRVLQTGFNTSVPNANSPAINYLLTETKYDQSCGQTGTIYTGKVCQTDTRILQTNDWLTNHLTYDIFGRTIYIEGNNHLDLVIGSEKDSTVYDYADNVINNKRWHRAFGKVETLSHRNSYDHVGRNRNIYHQYNTASEEWLSHQTYTVKDELLQKQLGLTALNNALQTVDYEYLPNRFLSAINPSLTGNDLFSLDLNYDVGNGSFAPAQKNGNISQLTWQTQGQLAETYGFEYDFLNRLTKANSGTITPARTSLTTNNKYNTTYSYDSRGNLTNLTRQGLLPNQSFGDIDLLNYDPVPNSNRIQRIVDTAPTANRTKGFNPNNASNSAEYAYDENGNLSDDPYKDMRIYYNFLNLPDTIIRANKDTIIWLYDATGVKLRKEARAVLEGTLEVHENPIISDLYLGEIIQSMGTVPQDGQVTFKAETEILLSAGFQSTGNFHALIEPTGVAITRQEYCGGIEYKDTALEAIYHSVGRLYFEHGERRYEYTLTDHLGNIRIMFSDIDGNGSINASTEILQENHYYPFGLTMEGSWTLNTGNPNDYLYNGKELQDDFGLGWYDYGARFYDPVIARWNAVDPLAEEYYSISPYTYVANNPIIFIDPDGMSLDLGGDMKAGFEDIRSTLSKKDRDRLSYNEETGEISFNIEGLKMKNGRIKNWKARAINDLVSSDKKYVFDNSATVITDKGVSKKNSDGTVIFSVISKNHEESSTKFPDIVESITPSAGYLQGDYKTGVTRKDGGDVNLNLSVTIPRDGYDGQVVMHPDISPSNSRADIVRHALKEVYNRTDKGMSYKAAHKAAGHGSFPSPIVVGGKVHKNKNN